LRRQNDFYETSKKAVNVLLDYLPKNLGQVFEPCAGKNAITIPIRESERARLVLTNDWDEQYQHNCRFDARSWFHWDNQETAIDWTITNPPFSYAFEILKNAYKKSHIGVAFLLRLSFLEPTIERASWLNEHPPTGLIILPRYSFTGDGKTDTVTCAWMIWNKTVSSQTIHISKRFR
jgi:hypothetical protein